MVVEWVTFRVRSGKEHEFETHHQEWVKMMRRTRGYISEVMLRSLEDPAEYRSEVRWVSQDYRNKFNAHEDKEGKALVQKGAALLEGPPSRRLLEPV